MVNEVAALDEPKSFEQSVSEQQLAVAREYDQEMSNMRDYLLADLEPDHTLLSELGQLNTTQKHQGRTAAAELAGQLDSISLFDSQNRRPVNAGLSRKLSDGFRSFFVAEEQLKDGNVASAAMNLIEARKQLEAFKTDLYTRKEYAKSRNKNEPTSTA
jgi:hypothetical protein